MSLFTEGQATAPEIDIGRIQKIISERTIQMRLMPQVFPGASEEKRPRLKQMQSLTLLFETSELWLNVCNSRFVPAAVAKTLLVQTDGKSTDQRLIDIFVADVKVRLLRRWGESPSSVWDKQKWQFWNKPYVALFFAYIQSAAADRRKNVSKISYCIKTEISLEELLAVRDEAYRGLLNAAAAPWRRNYRF